MIGQSLKARFPIWVKTTVLSLIFLTQVFLATATLSAIQSKRTIEERTTELEKIFAVHEEVSKGGFKRLELIENIGILARLVTLETYSETNRTILIGIAVAVFANLTGMGWQILRMGPKQSKKD